MRKNIIVTLLIITIVATVGIYHLKGNDTKNIEDFTLNSILPSNERVVLTSSDEQHISIAGGQFSLAPNEDAIFYKSKTGGNVTKFICEELPYGCIYSLDERIFLITENSDEEKILCYSDCATKGDCRPIALTETGYMIFETESGEEIAVPTQTSTMERLIVPTEEIPFSNLAEEEKGSIFYFVEE